MSYSSVEDLPLSEEGGAQSQVNKPYDQLTEEQRAILIPSQMFDLKKDEPAFVFSRDNLRTIKRYEATVRQLPMPAEISENGALSVLGLEAQDVNIFFDNLRLHVDSWDDVEDSCKSMGADLQVFAENLIKEGASFRGAIKTLDSWDSSPDDPVIFEMLRLTDSENQIFSESVDAYLLHITEEISDKLEIIRDVRKRIDHFGDAITKNLVPMGTSLYGKFDSHDAADSLQSLETDIAKLDEDIQQKLDEYNGLVGTAFYGLVFGPLGLAITGGIYGAQAETVRAEKNELLERHAALLAKKNVLLGGGIAQFESVKSILKDMQFRLVDVSTATKNLEDVWVLLEAYAKSSLKKVKVVSTRNEVKRFVNGFERVISPWAEIRGITSKISELFNEALRAK